MLSRKEHLSLMCDCFAEAEGIIKEKQLPQTEEQTEIIAIEIFIKVMKCRQAELLFGADPLSDPGGN